MHSSQEGPWRQVFEITSMILTSCQNLSVCLLSILLQCSTSKPVPNVALSSGYRMILGLVWVSSSPTKPGYGS